MYELDDGPLSQEQIELIRKISTCFAISCANFTEKLFPIDDNLVEISDCKIVVLFIALYA